MVDVGKFVAGQLRDVDEGGEDEVLDAFLLDYSSIYVEQVGRVGLPWQHLRYSCPAEALACRPSFPSNW